MSDNPPFGPPRRISDEETVVSLTGLLFAWRDDKPDYLAMTGTNDLFLATFSTTEQLYEFHQDDGNLRIKRIDDQPEFLSSLPYWIEPGVRLRVIINPYVTPQQTIRFKEVKRSPPLMIGASAEARTSSLESTPDRATAPKIAGRGC